MSEFEEPEAYKLSRERSEDVKEQLLQYSARIGGGFRDVRIEESIYGTNKFVLEMREDCHEAFYIDSGMLLAIIAESLQNDFEFMDVSVIRDFSAIENDDEELVVEFEPFKPRFDYSDKGELKQMIEEFVPENDEPMKRKYFGDKVHRATAELSSNQSKIFGRYIQASRVKT